MGFRDYKYKWVSKLECNVKKNFHMGKTEASVKNFHVSKSEASVCCRLDSDQREEHAENHGRAGRALLALWLFKSDAWKRK